MFSSIKQSPQILGPGQHLSN